MTLHAIRRPPIPREPRTLEEWQEVADYAECCLLLDSARQYGLVVGGPVVNVARCLDLRARAAAQGITPMPGGVDRAIDALIKGV